MESGPQVQTAQVDLVRFCTHSSSNLLGSSIQGEFLYMVQPCKISVYEYHGKEDRPQPTEELIHNAIILNFAISRQYICIYSDGQVEVRDRRHWSNVIMTRACPQNEEQVIMFLNENQLFVSKIERDRVLFERIDLTKKDLISTVDMGPLQGLNMASLKSNPPIFLRNLGAMSDFYIIQTGLGVELGVLFADEEGGMRKFEMSRLEIKELNIQKVYLHASNPDSNGKTTEYLILVARNKVSQEITVHIRGITPKVGNSDENSPQLSGALEELLKQYTYVSELNGAGTSQGESLVDQVLSQAMKEESQVPQQPKNMMKLELSEYLSSFKEQDCLWIASRDKVCSIKIKVQGEDPQCIQWVKSVSYQRIPKGRHFVGVYGGRPLFYEETVSYEITYQKQPMAEIQQQIQQYDVNDQVLDGQTKSIQKHDEHVQKMRNDLFMVVLEETEKELERKERMGQSQEVKIDYPSSSLSPTTPPLQRGIQQSSSTEIIKSSEYGTQTDEAPKRGHSLQFEEVQDLVLKYSTALSAHCNKVKQSQYCRQKIEKEVEKIVRNVTSQQIEPFLEQHFVNVLSHKVTEISAQISSFLAVQLEGLNEEMRKAQIKEGALRGRRIFDFSSQVSHMKQTTGGLLDAFKTNEVQRQAFNEIILQEAQQIKERVATIEQDIVLLAQRGEAAEEGVRDQVKEIQELMKRMREAEKAGSESWMEESGDESDDVDEEMSGEDQSNEQSEDDHSREDARKRHSQLHDRGRLIQIREQGSYSIGFGGGAGYYPNPNSYYPPPPQPYYPPQQPYYPPYSHSSPPFHSYPTPPPQYPPAASFISKPHKKRH